MDAGGAGHLGQTLDTGFDFLARDHHQVGHFVDDHNDIGQRHRREFFGFKHRIAGFLVKAGLDGALEHLALGKRLFHAAIVAFDVAHAHFGHFAIALFHLAHDPFQGHDGLFGVGHNGRQEMRDAVIDGKFQHLGVDHDQAAFFRRQLIQQRQDHRVDRHRLARPGGPGDQKVGHLGKVGHDGIAANVLAQGQGQAQVAVAKVTRGQNFAQDHLFAGDVRQFNANHRAAGNGRDAGRQRRHGPGDIVGKADHAAGLQAGRGFQFIHCDNWAGADRDDLALHAIVIQHGFQHAGVFFQRLIRKRHALDGGGVGQQRQRRQFIGRGRIVKPQAGLGLGHGAGRRGNRFLGHMLHH